MRQWAARGSAMVPVMVTALALAVVLTFGICLFIAASPERKAWYGAFETGPGKLVWVEFRGDRARVAGSWEALGEAAWVQAESDMSGDGSHREWPFISLPLAGERPLGWEKAEASFSAYGWFPERLVGWRLARRDGRGSEWSYRMDSAMRLGASPREVAPLALPDGGEWRMAVAPRVVAGDEFGAAARATPAMGVRVMVLPAPSVGWRGPLFEVRKDGKVVRATVTTRDDAGKVMAEEIAVPIVGPGSDVSVPVPDAKRGYVCEAVLDAGPAAGTLHASATVPAEAWKPVEQATGRTGVGFRGGMRRGGEGGAAGGGP